MTTRQEEKEWLDFISANIQDDDTSSPSSMASINESYRAQAFLKPSAENKAAHRRLIPHDVERNSTVLPSREHENIAPLLLWLREKIKPESTMQHTHDIGGETAIFDDRTLDDPLGELLPVEKSVVMDDLRERYTSAVTAVYEEQGSADEYSDAQEKKTGVTIKSLVRALGLAVHIMGDIRLDICGDHMAVLALRLDRSDVFSFIVFLKALRNAADLEKAHREVRETEQEIETALLQGGQETKVADAKKKLKAVRKKIDTIPMTVERVLVRRCKCTPDIN